jgi:hypothetical protein
MNCFERYIKNIDFMTIFAVCCTSMWVEKNITNIRSKNDVDSQSANLEFSLVFDQFYTIFCVKRV